MQEIFFKKKLILIIWQSPTSKVRLSTFFQNHIYPYLTLPKDKKYIDRFYYYKSGMRDSNSRPLGPKPSALAIWANSRILSPRWEWWAWVDSNHRPHPYQRCALTAWATRPLSSWIIVVPRGRIELPTQGFSGLCSTTELPWLIKERKTLYLFSRQLQEIFDFFVKILSKKEKRPNQVSIQLFFSHYLL